jgi:fumarate hydratase subunit beta
MIYYLTTPLTDQQLAMLRVGDEVFLSGELYTARDAAHQRMMSALTRGEELPISIVNQLIYYVGPTPARPGQAVGSCGPTSSYRMDKYSPTLLALGMSGMIGKGKISQRVIDALVEYGKVYFGSIGGAGALLSTHVVKSEVIAYGDLGPEAIHRYEVKDFPVIVLVDSLGQCIFK